MTSDALPDTPLVGEVLSVGVLAESGGWRDPNRRDYTVRISLDGQNEQGLKPAMRCKAEIYVDRVILKRNDRYETLRLPIEFIAGDPEVERRRQEEITRVVTDYRDTFLSRDGMALIKLFGFKPAYKNGGFTGFIVTAMFVWPWIDRLLIRITKSKETSTYIGIVAVLLIVGLTVWEAAVAH